MLKYQNLLNQLNLEEKIKLITSKEKIKNNQNEVYSVPLIDYTDEMKDIIPNVITPSINSLGAIYDKALIEEYGVELGKYLASIKYNKIINIPIGPILSKDSVAFSSSRLVTASLGAALARGIEKGGFLASYGTLPELEGIDLDKYFNDDLYSYKVAFNDYKPYSCIMNTCDSLDTVIGDYEYKGLKVVIAKNDIDSITAINHNCELTIVEEENIELIKNAVLKYDELKKKLSNGEINNLDFTSAIIKGEAINPYTIDSILDELFSHLSVFEEKTNQNVEFDSLKLNEIEYRLSQARVILLKNDDDILPFKRENKVSFIGDMLFKPKLNTNMDVKLDVLEIIDKYHLETCGVARGYLKGEELDDDVFNKAVELINSSEYSFIFLDTLDNKIPKEQLDFLERIKPIENVNIIPVLYSTGFVDITPLLDFKAIIFNMGDTKSMLNATMDVITGKYNPTGRLPFALKSNINDFKFKSDENLIYQLGHGLSYSKFNYTSITIDNSGIILAVTNKSDLAGTDALLFTTKYLNTDKIENNIIRDFITIDLEPHESKIVEFKYTFNSFAVTIPNKNESIIRGGSYNVQLMTEFDNVLKENQIILKPLAKNEVTDVSLEESYDNLDDSIMDFVSDVKKTNLVSTKTKVVTTILLSIYFYALLILWAIFNKNMASKIIIFSLIGVVFIIDICLFIKFYKDSKIKDVSKYESLKNVINSSKNFDELSHETYKEPLPVVEEKEEEEEIVETIEEPEIIETKEVEYYYDERGEVITDNLEYINEDQFDDIVEDFVHYALKNGLIIENIMAKELFASILSSKFVLVNNKTDILNAKLFEVLNSYLGNDNEIMVYMDSVSNSNDIYWNLDDDGKYVISDYTNNLIRASHLKKRFNLFVFRHTSLSQINELLNDYVEFAKTPKVKNKIDIGNNHQIELSDNIVFIAMIDDMNYLENIDERLSNYTVSLELITRANEIESEEVKIKYNSYNYYQFLLKNAKEVKYLNEDTWKKIDDFSESNIFNDFYIDSRTLNICEKIVAVMLSCDVDQNDALNTMFKLRIIPMLKRTKAYKEAHGDKVIIELLEKIFDDRLENAIKILKKPE